MSSVLVFTHRSGRKKRQGPVNNTRKIERFFIVLVLLLVLTIVFEILFHFYVAPSLTIKKIEISSSKTLGMSNNEIIKITGLSGNSNYFDVKSDSIKQRLLAVSSIKSVTVKKIFPSKIFIKIENRVPVGVCFIKDAGGMVPVAVGEKGILFPVSKHLNTADFPVISGIDVPSLKKGARLPLPLCSFLEDLESIRTASPELYSLISEIKFVKKNGMDYDVVLFPVNSKIRVRIGKDLNIKMLKYIILMLDVISKQPAMSNLKEIDMRSGAVVYRMQGE